jgi:nucleotide-binding universal stress UspA family protein
MKIVVPVDGSPASIRAAKLAVSFARAKRGSRLILVNVQNLISEGLGEAAAAMPPGFEERTIQHLGRMATHKVAGLCAKARVRFKTCIESGAIAPTIARVVAREGADHIVMGTRGMGGVRGLLLGSVATKVVQLSSVPVTLVK